MSELIEDLSIMRNDLRRLCHYDNELLQGHHKDLVRSMRVAVLLYLVRIVSDQERTGKP
jgi:hypothetical protein